MAWVVSPAWVAPSERSFTLCKLERESDPPLSYLRGATQALFVSSSRG